MYLAGISLGECHRPLPSLLVPGAMLELVVELHVFVCAVLGCRMFEIRLNLSAAGPITTPLRITLECELIRVRRNITRNTGVAMCNMS